MYMTVSFAEKLFLNFFPSNGKRWRIKVALFRRKEYSIIRRFII